MDSTEEAPQSLMKGKPTMAKVPFREVVSGVVPASGNLQLGVGPIGARERWHVDQASVNVSTTTLEAECGVYVGDGVLRQYFRDLTISGSSGDSSTNMGVDCPIGWKVWAAFRGADVAAIATLIVTGTKDV
jgi:hypothetical protein